MKKLCELQPGEKCCVVGTLFKAMQLQPSILREVSEEVRPAVPHAPFLEHRPGGTALDPGDLSWATALGAAGPSQ